MNAKLMQIAEQRFNQLLQHHQLENISIPLRAELIKALALSDFLGDVWLKQKVFFQQCLVKLPPFPIQFTYQTILTNQLKTVTNFHELQKCTRLFRHRALAEICLWQSLGLATVEQILLALSELAESLILATRDWLYHQACQEMGTPCDNKGNPQPLIVIAMGKLGGRELNFSSDIDLIFAYPEKGMTQGTRREIDNQIFFTRLSQRLIQALNDFNEDGFVYRVDMRLRPFGEDGALVLSFAALEQYYQTQGRNWERYAMLKARVLGKDENHLLTQILRPFMYRRYIDFSAIQALREMKNQITIEVRRRQLVNNIKLGTGGIREIEFIVQVFQLIRGGREPILQNTSLLSLLPKLESLRLLLPHQCQQLHAAYLFLRHSENCLQAIADQQTQNLPTHPRDQQRLIESCQQYYFLNTENQPQIQHYTIKNWQDYCQVLAQHQQNVHCIFQQLINEEGQGEYHSQWGNWLEENNELAHIFADSPQFTSLLPQLLNFKQYINKRPMGERGRQVIQKLLPQMIAELPQPAIPFFIRILTILQAILTRTPYLELLLENPPVRQQLIELCSRSQMIAEQVAKHPILLDELLNRHALLHPTPFQQYPQLLREYLLRLPPKDEEVFIDALRQFKQSIFFQIAAADILEALPVMKVSDHLTYLAQSLMQEVVDFAWQQVTQRFGVPQGLPQNQKGFLIVAYGKLGGIELGYKSDLDVVFLFDNQYQGETQGGRRCIDNALFYAKLTQKIISLFTLRTASGQLYDLDIRLRPEGDSGLICCSLQSFAHYQQKEAWTWETQALVRSRAICGDKALQAQFETLRQQILTTARNKKDLRQDVRAMREKMWQSHSTHSFHLKTDRGGITDIEFIAQYLVLANAPNYPHLAKWSDNVRIFENILQAGNILPNETCIYLIHCYKAFRNQIHHQNLMGTTAYTDENMFAKERKFIQSLWQDLFSD